MKPAYTTTEKLHAERLLFALLELGEALASMHQDGWHKTEDKNLRLAYIGTKLALVSQNITVKAAKAILDAPHANQIDRLQPWNGYPE